MVERESTSQIQFQNNNGMGKGEREQGRNVSACSDLSQSEPLNSETRCNECSLLDPDLTSSGNLKRVQFRGLLVS